MSIKILPAIFALIVAAAGWFYLFYSRAATRLSSVEASRDNRTRVRFRQIGGVAMMLLAFAFYSLFVAVEREDVQSAAGYMVAVLIFMMMILTLGILDLRLTRKLRRAQRRDDV